MSHNAKAEFLSLVAFAMVLADKSHETFGQTDETDAEGAVIDDRLDGVGRFQYIRTIPQFRHHQGELFGKGSLLEVETVAQLTGSHFEYVVEILEEFFDTFLLVLYAHALDCDAYDVDGCEAEVSSADGCLLAVAVLEHTGAAAHGCHLILVTLGIVGIPFLMLIERCVEIDKIGEEPTGRNLACQLVEVVIGIFGQVAYTTLFLPYLNREYRCGAVADSLVCGLEQFADDAAAFG